MVESVSSGPVPAPAPAPCSRFPAWLSVPICLPVAPARPPASRRLDIRMSLPLYYTWGINYQVQTYKESGRIENALVQA